jgi:hypothetical protein
LSFDIAAPEQLVDNNSLNLDFVMTLTEAKRIPLLSIRIHTDVDQRLTFGDQIYYPLDHIYIPADRSIKRSRLVATIASDGSGLKPLTIVPRLTIEWELCFWGYEVTKVIFEYQEHGFITIQFFEKWVNKVLLLSHAEQPELQFPEPL